MSSHQPGPPTLPPPTSRRPSQQAGMQPSTPGPPPPAMDIDHEVPTRTPTPSLPTPTSANPTTLTLWNITTPSSPRSPHILTASATSITSLRPFDPSLPPPPTTGTLLDGRQGLLLPALCHPHIHLDKSLLLPPIHTGSFQEALSTTAHQKSHFTASDLLSRGRRLILSSLESGVTALRCHVEVDPAVGLQCVDAALQLKHEFATRGLCDIQVAIFAQDPIDLSGQNNPAWTLLRKALNLPGVDALGSAPYVEPNLANAKYNINWVIDMAMLHRKHVDFHLDYNIDRKTEPLVEYVISQLVDKGWTRVMPKNLRVTLSHCTRLGVMEEAEKRLLALAIRASGLPIHFVGLPTSDLYMLGRPPKRGEGAGASEGAGNGRRTESEREEEGGRGGGMVPRATLPVLEWIKRYGFSCALGVNNVGNAFAPFGGVDPLTMVSAVGPIYQGGSEEDCRLLLECITTRARDAIGLGDGAKGVSVKVGDDADFVIIGNRGRTSSVQEVAGMPGLERMVFRKGRLVAKREVDCWIA